MEEKKGIDQFYELISDKENFKEIINLGKEWINTKTMEKNGNIKLGISDRVYSILVLLLCLSSVIYLSVTKVLDGISAGTLIGAIIGYALGKTRNSED